MSATRTVAKPPAKAATSSISSSPATASSSGSAYKNVVRSGGLKLKGGPNTIDKTKKRVAQTVAREAATTSLVAAAVAVADESKDGDDASLQQAAIEAAKDSGKKMSEDELKEQFRLFMEARDRESRADTRTKAEKQYDEVQRLKEKDIISKKLKKTHRELINEYNEYLANLSEHNDIPRVGPG